MDLLRHLGIFDPEPFKDYLISVVGLGAIGGGITEALARMGFDNFELIDFDTVEEHNIPNQIYFKKDVGRFKVEAAKEKINLINQDARVIMRNEKFKDLRGTIVFVGTDNMTARREVFDYCKKNPFVKLLIDGRMAGLNFTVHTVDMENPRDIEQYEKRFFGDDKMLQLPCTERAIIFNVFGVASFLANQLVKFLKQENYNRFITLDYKTMTFAKL